MLWSSLESLSLAALSFVMLAMLARYLDADTFGRAAIALGVVQIACSFVESFFHDAVVQRKNLQASDVDAAHTSGLLMALLLAAAIAAGAAFTLARQPQTAEATGAAASIGVAELALWMAPSVLMSAGSALAIAQLRRGLAMRQLAIAMAGSRALAGVVSIVALMQGAGVWAMVIHQNLAALGLLVLLAVVRAPRARLTRHLSGAWSLAGYAAWNSVSGLLNANLSRFFQVASSFVLPAAVVGQLSLALRIVEMLVSVLVTGVARVALSRLAAAAHEGRDVVAQFTATTGRLCLVMVPVLALLAVLAEPLVLFIGRSGWGQAASLVAWFALAQAVRSPVFLANTLFLALGRPRLSLAVSLVDWASLALLTLALQSPLAWVARLGIVLPLVLVLLQRFGIGLRELMPAVRGPALAALLTGVLLHAALPALGRLTLDGFVPAPLATLLLGGLGGAGVYASLAAALLGAPRVAAVWRNLFKAAAGSS